jgi:excisionase family DNA binding protein
MEAWGRIVHQFAAEPFLTPSEVLLRLRVNVKTLYRLIGDGDLPAVRVGRQWRVRPNDLDTWLRNHQNGSHMGPDHAGGTPGGPPDGNHACRPRNEGALLREDCV